jgi:hypothetical protein
MSVLRSTVPIRDRVAAGAVWLDEHGPADWDARIDLDSLDIGNGYYCILGQVYGHYTTAPFEARDPHSFLSVDRGFNGHAFDMPALHEAWRTLILDRR